MRNSKWFFISLPGVWCLVIFLKDLCGGHCYMASSRLMTLLYMWIITLSCVFTDNMLEFQTLMIVIVFNQMQLDSWSARRQKFLTPLSVILCTLAGPILTLSMKLIRDLGIVFDSQLKFYAHAALVARKANRILVLINRCFNTLDSTSFMTL